MTSEGSPQTLVPVDGDEDPTGAGRQVGFFLSFCWIEKISGTSFRLIYWRIWRYVGIIGIFCLLVFVLVFFLTELYFMARSPILIIFSGNNLYDVTMSKPFFFYFGSRLFPELQAIKVDKIPI